MLNHVIPLFKVFMPLSVKAPLLETLFSGYIGQGEQVEKFEACLAKYINNPHALTVNSGTSGLQLALRLANVGSGDEVISTPMTCTATNMTIMACGARIVWADIDPVSGNIDPGDVQKKITPKTKAIMMVHWGGTPCEIDALQSIAADYGIRVIEDAAHSMGAEYKGKKIGCHSDFVVFSFQAVKQMTTIDGGVLFCRHKADYERGKRLRWFGIDRKLKGAEARHECGQNISEWGYKFHMNDVCAVIGIEQLKYLDANLQKSRNNARFYAQELEGINGATILPLTADINGSFLFYTLHINKNHSQFSDYMYKNGIMVSQVHARNDKNFCFKPFSMKQLIGVDSFVRTMMCIPSGWWVDEVARKKIVFAIRSYFDR